jgi:hypothetical protein
MGTGSFPGVKLPGRGADHPPLLAPRSRKSRAITLPPPLWAFESLMVYLYLLQIISLSLYIYTYTHTHTQHVQQDATLVSWFYCKITLHVSGTFRTHHQGYNNCSWQPTGTTYVTLDRELCCNVYLKTVHDRTVGYVTVVELELVCEASNLASSCADCLEIWEPQTVLHDYKHL